MLPRTYTAADCVRQGTLAWPPNPDEPHLFVSSLHPQPTRKAPERLQYTGGRLELDEDDVPVVISPAVAAHLRLLADVLLRNGESGAFKAYVEVRPPSSLCPLRRSRGF